ncbi:MAG: hypothetical protein KJ941_01960 [Bacteroidetes bacterium]|nr:hypothetical protein [Bacteroidota bacterium]
MARFYSLFVLIFVTFSTFVFSQDWKGNKTPTYDELVMICKHFSAQHDEIEMYQMGESDGGIPIHLLIINGAKDSVETFVKAKNGTTILVNNAIHPGEPDGVNAMILWIEKWVKAGKPINGMPLIAFVPSYNVGGMLNRSSTSRANQDGPESYGFRGNERNFDLNRDFIKMDTKNASTFVRLYQALNPDVFIDNHVTNGADYQYTLTLISSLKERMTPIIENLTYKKVIPYLNNAMKQRGFPISPYVDLKGSIPDSGLVAFNDIPRYSMGYASLFHSLSFTVETHMLKEFPKRVEATMYFFESILKFTMDNASEIELARKKAINQADLSEYYKWNYELDTTRYDFIDFMGYTAKYKTSEVTGVNRMYYDRNSPWTKKVKFYNSHYAMDSVKAPNYFLIAATETEILKRLRQNQVEMSEFSASDQDVFIGQRVVKYSQGDRPYEGHFSHHSSKVNFEKVNLKEGVKYFKVSTHQAKRNFILHVLLANCEDSYFTWNFMDSYLDQKEYFSPYVFEDIALKLLEENPSWRKELNELKETDPDFAQSQWQQLMFVYKKSPYFENTVGLLPILLLYED